MTAPLSRSSLHHGLSRRTLLRLISHAAGIALLSPTRLAHATERTRPELSSATSGFMSRRPPKAQRRFVSPAVEQHLTQIKAKIADPELAWLFENCYPNTLDTTVTTGTRNGKPDTVVITGDIQALWLRDSAAQVHAYVPLSREDPALRHMLHGLIQRHAACIRLDPYANAFLPDDATQPLQWAVHDITEMQPGIGERKWEVDSLCYPIRLAHAYWRASDDTTPFDDDWRDAMHIVLRTFSEQQRLETRGPYTFQRPAPLATETLMLEGYGAPTRPNGMLHAMFRPSDDACVYPLLVPANLFAVVTLRQLATMSEAIHHDVAFASECRALAHDIEQATQRFGQRRDTDNQPFWVYEVDGYGNQLFMDDANAPSLLSLAYLGCCASTDPVFLRTRTLAWSERNPYFYRGRAATGVGSPHTGLKTIWPMSIIHYALASHDDTQIQQCLHWLKSTHAGTGFMHEAFNQDDANTFTRGWFAWANSLFGELIIDLAQRKPHLLGPSRGTVLLSR
ncbi:metal-independent alpha-mannosidase [Xylella taiwanensis]|uniref:Glycoside hydrolase family 125 protein n=2 Tax=Xylella taiwanensis TaxID=1444770 RepID=A0ABS8TRV5_9GAMM|nr:glycoside hydrolase family 125 protein [Xylella taiwanensis]AXI84464.1 Tat pathway signal protein [Xylella taiwanensis]MCD8455361.1 glycoside hydrolase family 125 protein [Xylella taiwanensis]MCD8457765.1 glycoside hydrolase family 125 protein [Xylella taiwanensis]MCD8459900.1 glycoside hydrolase family 125 protein [Xylella taiwanensis]MCD8464038.1 glycoside hydrolase family 125 protein [Xylella taiwanensis]